LGGRLAEIAEPGDHHLVIDEIGAVFLAQQEVGAVDILGIDRRHDERRDPGADRLVIFGQ
jgi:hypothetical protein